MVNAPLRLEKSNVAYVLDIMLVDIVYVFRILYGVLRTCASTFSPAAFSCWKRRLNWQQSYVQVQGPVRIVNTIGVAVKI